MRIQLKFNKWFTVPCTCGGNILIRRIRLTESGEVWFDGKCEGCQVPRLVTVRIEEATELSGNDTVQ